MIKEDVFDPIQAKFEFQTTVLDSMGKKIGELEERIKKLEGYNGNVPK